MEKEGSGQREEQVRSPDAQASWKCLRQSRDETDVAGTVSEQAGDRVKSEGWAREVTHPPL